MCCSNGWAMVTHMTSSPAANTKLEGVGVLRMSRGPGMAEGAVILRAVGMDMEVGLALVALRDKGDRWWGVGYGDRLSPSSRFYNHF